MNFKLTIGVTIALFIGLFFAIGLISGASNLITYLNQSKIQEVAKGGQQDSWKKTLVDYEVEVEITEEKEEPKKENSENNETDQDNFLNQEGKNLNMFEIPHYYKFKNADEFPLLTSKAYVVADLDTGKIIAGKAKDAIWPIASLTKLMTAVVALETLDVNDTATVSYSALQTYGAQGGLSYKDKLTINDLFYPLLLESSNDSAEVIAEFPGRNTFMSNMNGKSASLGLTNTYFKDPSGLSYENVSTPTELFNLVRYIDKTYPEIFEITKLKDYRSDKFKWFSNSRFRNDSDYIGGKNGYTDEALQTLISIWDLPLAENENRRIVIILLQSTQSEKDTRAAKLWLLENVYYKS